MLKLVIANKLYSSWSLRPWVLLKTLDIPFEEITIPLRQPDSRERVLEYSPSGKVPALIDGDQIYFESVAILLHLGDKYGTEKRLWPTGGGQARADALSWTVWGTTELGSHLLQWIYHGLNTPVSFEPTDRSKAAAEYSRSQFVCCLDALHTRLDGREHLLGSFSLVDIACGSWLHFGGRLGVALDSHPRVAAWLTRCSQRPALARAR